MEAVMQLSLVILIAAVVALNVFALWYGSDSRDGDDWINHRA
jgi:hypothetical protein